jgi:glycosyltransferase involved in cell wall biosynthesis
VSQEVADAVSAAGANGPVHAIPNGIDLGAVASRAVGPRDIDALIVAIKKPALGAEVHDLLGDGRSAVIDQMIPRERFLDTLGRARVAVFLPNDTEGFYLPALEAMALGTVVVCPDVVGNRSFCVDGRTAIVPAFERRALVDAARAALAMSASDVEALVESGREMAASHDIATERSRFLEILDDVDGAWTALGYPQRP